MFDPETIKHYFDITYETGALIVKPATDEEIARCKNDLAEISASGSEDYIASIRPGAKSGGKKEDTVPLTLPADYAEFLKIANGYAWNGFQFFGTYQVTVKKSGYTLSDIVGVNQYFRERKYGLADRIVLGDFDDDLFVYDFKTSKYYSLDRTTLIMISEYDSFSDLLSYTVGECVTFDDESWGVGIDPEECEENYPEDDGNTDS